MKLFNTPGGPILAYI